MLKRKISYIRWGDLPKNMRPSGKTASPDTKVYIDPQTGHIPFTYELSQYDLTNPKLYTPIPQQPQADVRYGSDNIVDAQQGATYSPEFNRNFYGTSDYSALFGDSRVQGMQRAWEHNPEAMQQWTDAGNLVGDAALTFLPIGEVVGPAISTIGRGTKSIAPKIVEWLGRGLTKTPIERFVTSKSSIRPAMQMMMVTPEGVSTTYPVAATTSSALRYTPQVVTGALGLGTIGALLNNRIQNTISLVDQDNNYQEYLDSAAVARAYGGNSDTIQTPAVTSTESPIDTTATPSDTTQIPTRDNLQPDNEDNEEPKNEEPKNEESQKEPNRFKRAWRELRGKNKSTQTNTSDTKTKYSNWNDYYKAHPRKALFWEKPSEFESPRNSVIRNGIRLLGYAQPFAGLRERINPIIGGITGGAFHFILDSPNDTISQRNTQAIYTQQQADSIKAAGRNQAFVVGKDQIVPTRDSVGAESFSQGKSNYSRTRTDQVQ